MLGFYLGFGRLLFFGSHPKSLPYVAARPRCRQIAGNYGRELQFEQYRQ
jgi:hypothetical protein